MRRRSFRWVVVIALVVVTTVLLALPAGAASLVEY
jgi:hypothetical protein